MEDLLGVMGIRMWIRMIERRKQFDICGVRGLLRVFVP